MRIKINDKIYRLKEIESGVDSLMELVEEPKYKDGDFVVSEFGSILIFKEADGGRTFDHACLPVHGELIIDKVAGYYGVKRHATTEEKQRMIEALAKKGKRWNDDKKCVDDWLEPWSDEPKVGDWVVFWDHSPKAAKVGVLTGIRSDSWYKYRIDGGACFQHAVKWDGTKEHLEKVRKGW